MESSRSLPPAHPCAILRHSSEESNPWKARATRCGKATCMRNSFFLLGTPHEPDTRDPILFLEDIDETPHRIDRDLTQLLLARKLESVRGLVFGSFSRSAHQPDHEYRDFPVALIDIIKDRVLGLRPPCIFGLPFGHVRDPCTIPFGGQGHLDATGHRLIVEVSVT
ncbi:MAG TPA: hypothetical protein DCR97_09765 [Deltaproteobacteria bacterium]|nr:hypothetical protein [Deltaproteobacteria bacterium]